MAARAGLAIQSDIESDTAPLHGMVAAMLARKEHGIRCLRDPTRGGVATVLAEIAEKSQVQININEDALPLRPGVSTACELLGLDPLYLANEGKCIVIADSASAADLLAIMRATEVGRDAALIGRVERLAPGAKKGRTVLRTAVGGARLIGPLSGEPLPRIC